MGNYRKIKKVTIREDLISITDSCPEAVILGQFIYWSQRIKDAEEYLEMQNEIIRRFGGECAEIEYSYGWIYKTNQEMADETMMGLSRVQVGRYINKLVEKGYIEKRNNPKYQWDRTLQYRVNLVKIAEELSKNGYPLSDYRIDSDNETTINFKNTISECYCEDDKNNQKQVENDDLECSIESSKCSNDCSPMNNRMLRDERAIPYITTETTIQNLHSENSMLTFSKEKGDNKKVCSCSGKQEEKNQLLEHDLKDVEDTEEYLEEEIFPIINKYIYETYIDKFSNNYHIQLNKIILEFYKKYRIINNKEHRILSIEAYKRIADIYLTPPEELDGIYDLETYRELIDLYFKTRFNYYKKYDGTVTKSISHFFTETILKNLSYKLE